MSDQEPNIVRHEVSAFTFYTIAFCAAWGAGDILYSVALYLL